MTLTKPDFKLEKPNPNSKLITDAEWWLWLRLHELEPKTELGGIYADKKGFHNTGNRNRSKWPDNYSIRDAPNRSGAGMTHASALDWTFLDAQSGHYANIDRYTSRLLKSAQDRADPRLDMILYEFFGQADADAGVEGWDELHEHTSSSDSSHLWHIHMSFLRSECDDFWGMWALLTVLMGWTVAQWRASLPAPPKPPTAPKPTTPAGLPVVKLGSRTLQNTNPDMRGTDILTYQKFIKGFMRTAPDGVFGDDTERATRLYQDMRGYKVDGIAGPATLGPIVKALA